MLGPIFSREAHVAPRRTQHYLNRSVYLAALFALICTAWAVLAGTQIIMAVGDMARFGTIVFGILAPLQLAIVLFLGSLGAASAVAQEKDRRTILLLLLTRMTNRELVLGKLMASLLDVLTLLLAAIPLFMFMPLFGGISFAQIARAFGVCFGAALIAGSLGTTIAFWRDKTFQALAMTALILVAWISIWFVVDATLGSVPLGRVGDQAITVGTLAAACSPLQAILAAATPSASGDAWFSLTRGDSLFLLFSVVVSGLLNLIAIARVRVWNPSRELRPQQVEDSGSIFGEDVDKDGDEDEPPRHTSVEDEQRRAVHVDSIGRAKTDKADSREVWDNPVLWREVNTRAYGRKILLIKAAYLGFAILAAIGVYQSVASGSELASSGLGAVIPPAVAPLAPFFLISLVIVNALAVTSITNERDGQALDILLVTDISPNEFVFGKLGGVFWVTKEMLICPLLLCGYLFFSGAMIGEDLLFLVVGLLVMFVFANMLGVHCGMTYSNSRTAIGVSLGSVFFLFLGVVTCILVMISFSGEFHRQLPAFLFFSLGGSGGLYVALGIRNPSRAMFWASLLLPFATFYAVTSFLLGQNLPTFLVTAAVYGFTTAAMLMPALGEFDFAMGRTKRD